MLSLDAPTVAAVWAWSFAHSIPIQLPFYSIAILALGTWILYIADRILDGWRTLPLPELRERHYFHLRHWRVLLACGAGVSVALLWLILAHMPAQARREDTMLFLAAVAYFSAVHFRINLKRWFSKELIVGMIFAAATAVPAWSRLGQHSRLLTGAIALFAVLCWLNCIGIERWESFGSLRYRYFSIAGIAAMAFGLIGISFAQSRHSGTIELYAAEVLSAGLLFILDKMQGKLTPLALRVAADLALLTPLLILPFVA